MKLPLINSFTQGKPIATPTEPASSDTFRNSVGIAVQNDEPIQRPQRPPQPQHHPPPQSNSTFHIPPVGRSSQQQPPPPPNAQRHQQPSAHSQSSNFLPEGQYPHPGAAGGIFSSLKGGAGSFFKNLKDTSSKVMHTVQQSIARTDLDISAITSRILVMPCPSEGIESTYKINNIDDIKVYLESRHSPSKISIYNLGPRNTARLPPPVRTVEGGAIYAGTMHAPTLAGMYTMAEDMYGYLDADPSGILVVQSADHGRMTAATMVRAITSVLLL